PRRTVEAQYESLKNEIDSLKSSLTVAEKTVTEKLILSVQAKKQQFDKEFLHCSNWISGKSESLPRIQLTISNSEDLSLIDQQVKCLADLCCEIDQWQSTVENVKQLGRDLTEQSGQLDARPVSQQNVQELVTSLAIRYDYLKADAAQNLAIENSMAEDGERWLNSALKAGTRIPARLQSTSGVEPHPEIQRQLEELMDHWDVLNSAVNQIWTSGQVWVGIYFATNLASSARHSEDAIKCLLVCEVLVGLKWTCNDINDEIDLSMVQGRGCDSVYSRLEFLNTAGGRADDEDKDEYVIYRTEQATPRYLVKLLLDT
uniref:FATC domain-containing protein n=1 Tax=Macrostomum lignano TaxID=282301 RepID=A0A1I8G3G8_9PLAT